MSSRYFALCLIGIASIYVLIMICQAYSTNMLKMNLTESVESGYEYEYEYQTESYDFRQYQSHDTETGRSDARGFKYN
jgi:hypothetical protein